MRSFESNKLLFKMYRYSLKEIKPNFGKLNQLLRELSKLPQTTKLFSDSEWESILFITSFIMNTLTAEVLHEFMKKYMGMAVTPNLIIFSRSKDEVSQRLINHEKIHQSQMIQHGLLVFWLWYVAQYLYGLIKYRNHWNAYRHISYEVKARELEKI